MSNEPHLTCNRATCEKCIDDAEKIETLEATIARLRTELEAANAKLEGWFGVNTALNNDLAATCRQLDEARAALERLGREPCAFDGSYASCWEAVEADDIDAGEGIPCARCVSLQALERLTTSLAPTFSQLVQQAGELPVAGIAGAESPAPAQPHSCPSCDHEDNVQIAPGKLLASMPIKRPAPVPPKCETWCGEPGNSTRGAFADRWCSTACMAACTPQHPEKP